MWNVKLYSLHRNTHTNKDTRTEQVWTDVKSVNHLLVLTFHLHCSQIHHSVCCTRWQTPTEQRLLHSFIQRQHCAADQNQHGHNSTPDEDKIFPFKKIFFTGSTISLQQISSIQMEYLLVRSPVRTCGVVVVVLSPHWSKPVAKTIVPALGAGVLSEGSSSSPWSHVAFSPPALLLCPEG